MPLDKPFKLSIGKISKVILDKINQQIQLKTKANEWKGTSIVIEWFNNFENKERFSFFLFYIKSFYTSISENLFIKAIKFTKQMTEISDEDTNLIMQARKTLLFIEGIPLVKQERNNDFDIPIGCFNGEEVCELVASYILKQISKLLKHHSVRLYRDNGQAALKD